MNRFAHVGDFIKIKKTLCQLDHCIGDIVEVIGISDKSVEQDATGYWRQAALCRMSDETKAKCASKPWFQNGCCYFKTSEYEIVEDGCDQSFDIDI